MVDLVRLHQAKVGGIGRMHCESLIRLFTDSLAHYSIVILGVVMFNKFVISCSGWMDEGLNRNRNQNLDRIRQDELLYRYSILKFN